MHKSIFLMVAATLALASVASGEQTYDLQLMASGESRWADLFSAAFAQLDKGEEEPLGIDGMFVVTAEVFSPPPYSAWTFDYSTFEPAVFEPIGSGGDVFPNQGDFQGGYSIAYDDTGLSGVGREVAPLIGASFDFNADVANDDSLSFDPDGYDTVVTGVSGTVTLIDGEIASIDGVADVSLLDDYTFWGLGVLEFEGTVTFQGGSWKLYADGMHEVGAADPMRNLWDVHGVVEGLFETGLPGDYNNDGAVDAADYTVWRDRLGGCAGVLPNDIDGGMIGADQYETWRDNYDVGVSLVTLPVTTPEPSTALLGLIACVSAAAQRRPRG